MTVQFKCNGPDCERVMLKDEARIACTFVKATTPPDVDSLSLEPIEFVEVIDFTIDGGLHFCSPACMAAHGYAEHLKNLPS